MLAKNRADASTITMEKVILTPRLKLILQQTAATGSDDLRDYHKLRTDPAAALWTSVFPAAV